MIFRSLWRGLGRNFIYGGRLYRIDLGKKKLPQDVWVSYFDGGGRKCQQNKTRSCLEKIFRRHETFSLIQDTGIPVQYANSHTFIRNNEVSRIKNSIITRCDCTSAQGAKRTNLGKKKKGRDQPKRHLPLQSWPTPLRPSLVSSSLSFLPIKRPWIQLL